ncbi:MAG: pyruvate, phosphate dikinase [Polyangiales bacterium]
MATNRHVYFFGAGTAEGSAKQKELLGGKGAGLAEMTNLGVPVPPGFTITTEVCNAYFDHGEQFPDGLKEQVDASVAKIEALLSLKLGDATAPLLVSVRSGARASMPGMMDTILNLGLNDETVKGIAKKTGNPRFAYDTYRRFLTMYSDVVLGLGRHAFEEALEETRRAVAKERGVEQRAMFGEELKRRVPDSEIDAAKLEALCDRYKALVAEKTGTPFPQDVRAQLWGAIKAVFSSWNNQRAITYRRMHDLPASWGTACNVQAMVFGNLGESSATGVCFTRDPSTGERRLIGEWLPNAQGEDVVAGIRTPRKVSKGTGGPTEETLEVAMPETFTQLIATCERLESHFNDMQDIEFTIQEGKVFLLQCRAGKRSGKAAIRIATDMQRAGKLTKDEALLRVDPESLNQLLHPVLDPEVVRSTTPIAKGLNASPGAAVGALVFTADEAERRAGRGEAVLLVRTETSPEDIHGMKAAKGILTARGGMTSHAAVVARGMGTPCVAGCSALTVDERKKIVRVAIAAPESRVVEHLELREGDVISIDGGTGAVYKGALPLKPAELSAEYAELMSWADARRTLKVRTNGDTPKDARTARNYGAEGIGLCRTEHMFFGDDRIRAMREMILASTVADRRVALDKLLPFQREDFEGIFREMRGLPVTIRLLDPPLHEFLPHSAEQIAPLARDLGVTEAAIRRRSEELAESNPMLGHRGVRLAITYPEIYAMQVRAILEAALTVVAEGHQVLPEIMIPLTLSKRELVLCREIVDATSREVFGKAGRTIAFLYGTMIELPRAALRAGELAEVAEFFSFGTNDLTQTTLGISRDDADKTFLPVYVQQGILAKSPFHSIDVEGVGELITIAKERGRKTRPTLKLGICGEHGGDPSSVELFHQIGLDYVSCSPFRVPIARLAAAQAAIRGAATRAAPSVRAD